MEEDLLLEKDRVFVYKIPEKVHSQRKVDLLHQNRAATWAGGHPIWAGKLFIYKAGPKCHLQLRDGNGSIYAKATLKEYPGKDFEPVLDSSRYFTLNVRKGKGEFELVGLGFTTRSDSADVDNAVTNFLSKINVKPSHEFEDNPSKNLSTDCEFIPEAVEKNLPKKLKQTESTQGVSEQNNLGAERKTEVDVAEETPLDLSWESKIPVAEEANGPALDEDLLDNLMPMGEATSGQERPSDSLMNVFKILKCAFCTHDQRPWTPEDLIQHYRDTHAAQRDSFTDNSGEDSHTVDLPLGAVFARTEDPTYKYFSRTQLLFHCHVCGEAFPQASQIMHHWRNNHNFQETEYCICGLPFPVKKELGIHMLEYHSVECHLCAKAVPSNSLEEHFLTEHLCNQFGRTIVSPAGRNFSCRNCEGWFSFRTYTWRHSMHQNQINKSQGLRLPEAPASGLALENIHYSGHSSKSKRPEGEGGVRKSDYPEMKRKKRHRKPRREFTCEYCQRIFRNPRDFIHHCNQDHPFVFDAMPVAPNMH